MAIVVRYTLRKMVHLWSMGPDKIGVGVGAGELRLVHFMVAVWWML